MKYIAHAYIITIIFSFLVLVINRYEVISGHGDEYTSTFIKLDKITGKTFVIKTGSYDGYETKTKSDENSDN